MITYNEIKAELEEYAQETYKNATGRRGKLVLFSDEFIHDQAMMLNQLDMIGRRELNETEKKQVAEWAKVYEEIKDLDIDSLYKKVTFVDVDPVEYPSFEV